MDRGRDIAVRALVRKLAGLPARKPVPLGTKVWARGGRVAGATVGQGFACTLEGCNGLRLPVKWPDGTRTYPCTKGMSIRTKDGDWEIE